MRVFFSIEHRGKRNIATRYGVCTGCGRLSSLCSYTTHRFITFLGLPILPVGHNIRILNECAYCHHRGTTTDRKFKKQRKRDLAAMMKEFSDDPDNPDTALHGLHTLMVYDEELWFNNCAQTYSSRFENRADIQLKIGEGLCRFGDYARASTYCRKAIVMGSEEEGNELLALCQKRQEQKESGGLPSAKYKPESMLRPYAFVILSFFALIAGAGAYVTLASITRPVWLVNGALSTYSVEIDGNTHRLSPYEHKSVSLRLGDHTLRVWGLAGQTNEIPFHCDANLRGRWSGQGALVINPDAMALLIEETRENGTLSERRFCGQAVNAFDHIDLPFKPFPANTEESPLVRLYHHRPATHAEAITLLDEYRGPETASEYARQALVANPAMEEADLLLPLAVRSMTPDETLAFLQTGTTNEPPLMTWHRFYHHFVLSQNLNINLQREYATRYNAHTDTPEYAYLAGLVTPDLDVARKFFERSETHHGMGGHGFHQMALDALCGGFFSDAAKFCQAALEKAPDQPEFKETERLILLARGQHEPLLQQIDAALAENPAQPKLMTTRIKYLTLLGRHQEASSAINAYAGRDAERLALLQSARFYAVGNVNDHLTRFALSNDPAAPLHQALHGGDLKTAFELTMAAESNTATDWLILYCAAVHQRQTTLANAAMSRAIAAYDPASPAHRTVVALLESPTAPTLRSVQQLRILPREKTVLCTALGFRHPDARANLFKLANAFNHTPDYPQLLIKKWIR